jgi:hypothetical protein
MSIRLAAPQLAVVGKRSGALRSMVDDSLDVIGWHAGGALPRFMGCGPRPAA